MHFVSVLFLTSQLSGGIDCSRDLPFIRAVAILEMQRCVVVIGVVLFTQNASGFLGRSPSGSGW